MAKKAVVLGDRKSGENRKTDPIAGESPRPRDHPKSPEIVVERQHRMAGQQKRGREGASQKVEKKFTTSQWGEQKSPSRNGDLEKRERKRITTSEDGKSFAKGDKKQKVWSSDSVPHARQSN